MPGGGVKGEEMHTTITQDENGTYHWNGTIDGQYDQKVIGIIFGSIGGMCVLFLVLAFVINREVLLVTGLSGLGVMAVTALVTIPLMRAGKGRQQKYEMNEEYIRYVGYGREDTYFHYKDIRRVVVHNSRNMIEVKGLVVTAPFFAAHEDFGFIRDYVIHRLPDRAEVVYE